MKYKKVKNNKGFSFIEVMIVISIIGIMSAVGMVGFNSSKSKTRLELSQRTLTAAIKLAQSYAIQGRVQESQVPCGYGVVFTSTAEFRIFYNISSAGKDCQEINAEPTLSNFKYNAGTSRLIDLFKLEKDVFLDSPVFVNSGVYFSTPRASAYNYSGVSLGTQAYTLKYNSSTKTVTVGSEGSVTEQ